MSSIVSEAAAPVAAGAASVTSAGAWLREARQQRGLHIAALAAMLKVPQAKLEALEADRWQDLPDTTFARALAKAMCRVLKVDAAPVMALLPRGSERELDVSRGLNQPYRERGGREESLSLSWLQRPVVWGPVLLLLAAAAVYLMPAHWLATSPEAASVPVEVSAPAVAEPLASAPVLAASEPAPAPAAAVSTQPLPAAISPVTTAAPAVPAPASAGSLPAAPVAAGLVPLKVKVSSESWVEVVDARGQTLLSKLLRPGDAQDLAGQPPLKVRVGNVAGTELVLRGSPVDLAAQSRDNVARLELN